MGGTDVMWKTKVPFFPQIEHICPASNVTDPRFFSILVDPENTMH